MTGWNLRQVPHAKKGQSWLAGACSILFAVLLIVVDPVISGASWWTMPDLWLPLAFPLLPWLGIAGLMTWLGSATDRWRHALMLSLISLAAGVIPSFIWGLLLFDAFPNYSSEQLPLTVSLWAGVAAVLLGVAFAVSAMIRRWRTTSSATTVN